MCQLGIKNKHASPLPNQNPKNKNKILKIVKHVNIHQGGKAGCSGWVG